MHLLSAAVFGIVALLWIIQGVRAARGMRELPRLSDVPVLGDGACPNVSVIFAARDEAKKLPAALETLLAQDYPQYEVVAADDRSRDATGRILDQFARTRRNLKVVHVTDLPIGWLGKPHALAKAYEQSNGEWLVFTDADVHFAPDLLRRSVTLAETNGLDHLTLITGIDLRGFWENTAVTYFGLGFVFGNEPWRVSNPNSRAYVGVGAFQLLRRSAYQAIGTHRRLALEIVDDMKLGKLVKLGGFRSGLAIAEQELRVRWHEGLHNIIRGVTKNLFAACGFRISKTLAGLAAAFALSILPFLGFAFGTGWPRVFAGGAALAAILVHAGLIRASKISPLYALTHPLGAAVFCYMLVRSLVVTLWHGGVEWRDTFYPLSELRRGLV